MAREQQNPAGMVAGLREVGRLMGFYAPERVKMALEPGAVQEMRRLETLSDQELLAMVGGGGVHDLAGHG